MILCRQMGGLVSDYLEGRMSVEKQAEFRLHLESCPNCETYIDQMEQVVRDLHQVTDEPVADEVMTALRQTFHAWQPGDEG